MKQRLLRAASLVLLALFLSVVSFGTAGAFEVSRWEFRAGYAYQYTNPSRPNNFQLLTFLPSASVVLAQAKKPGRLHGRLEWTPELFLGLFTHPYARPLIGVTPLQFRYVWETPCRFKPYLFSGAGILYANVNRRETRKDLNFNLQGGAGIYYVLNDSTSFIVEYRHTHISNAGLHEDNAGVNVHTFLAGVSIKR